jgi:hypothetical protein
MDYDIAETANEDDPQLDDDYPDDYVGHTDTSLIPKSITTSSPLLSSEQEGRSSTFDRARV